MSYETVLYEVADGVATVTLNRPEKLNALTDQLAEDVQAALREADAADDVRIVLLTGAGRGFCAGLDLTVPRPPAASRQARLDELGWVGRVALLITGMDKPVIAAVNGPAAGAGLSMALACDIRVMAAGVRITSGYVRRGLSPDGGMTFLLPRLIGGARAAEIILSGRDLDAAECERIGLVARVLPAESFHEAAVTYAKGFAGGPPLALTYAKRLLTLSPSSDLETQLRTELRNIRACFQSDDVKEGMRAFAERRTAVFSGR